MNFQDETPRHHIRHRARHRYLWASQILAVLLSFLGRSRIARFIAAKLGLSFVVEVTDRFGARAGHTVSTFVSALIAEPALIAVVVAGIFVVIDLIVLLVGRIRRRRRRPHRPHPF